MPTTKPEKDFDAVKFMREARARLSAQLRNLSFEEQKRFLKEQHP